MWHRASGCHQLAEHFRRPHGSERVENGLVPDQTLQLPDLNHCSLRGEVDPAKTCWWRAEAAAATGKARGACGHAALSWAWLPVQPLLAPSEGREVQVTSAVTRLPCL